VNLDKADVAKVTAITGRDGKARVFWIKTNDRLGYSFQTAPPALASTHRDLPGKAALMQPAINADSRVQLFFTDPDDERKLKSRMITNTWRSP